MNARAGLTHVGQAESVETEKGAGVNIGPFALAMGEARGRGCGEAGAEDDAHWCWSEPYGAL